ncbi:hypothetical protein C8R46DRAFT_238722 [Mycena filopes]|nr:hypothetical protein C8R46DRAFT_238722 [Mycena filopes]
MWWPEIFVACLPIDRNAVIDGAESPLLLCQICQAWRTLALSTPRLWASLHVVAPHDIPKLHEINEATAWWLSKSGALPLSISIAQSWKAVELDTDVSILLQTLVGCSSRWQRMIIHLSSRAAIRPLEGLSPADVPDLETVVLDDFPRNTAKSFATFLGANKLTSLSLRRDIGGLPFQAVQWNRLRHLFLGVVCQSVAEAIDLLHRCPNLETCALGFMANASESSVEGLARCHLPHLQRLSVQDYDDTIGAADFFDHLELPNLRTLEFVAESATQEFPITPLILGSHLHRFCLNIYALPSDTLIGWLRQLPSLAELVLCGDWFSFHHNVDGSPTDADHTVWSAMTPTNDTVHDVLCPQLRVMNFTSFAGFPDLLLLEFIRARTEYCFPGIAKLEKVRGQFTRRMAEDIVPALQQVIADGLDLSLRYGDLQLYSPTQRNIAHTPDGEQLSDTWWDELW